VGALVVGGDLERAAVRVDVLSKISAMFLPVEALELGAVPLRTLQVRR
jgi:hypothetical protein